MKIRVLQSFRNKTWRQFYSTKWTFVVIQPQHCLLLTARIKSLILQEIRSILHIYAFKLPLVRSWSQYFCKSIVVRTCSIVTRCLHLVNTAESINRSNRKMLLNRFLNPVIYLLHGKTSGKREKERPPLHNHFSGQCSFGSLHLTNDYRQKDLSNQVDLSANCQWTDQFLNYWQSHDLQHLEKNYNFYWHLPK